MDVVAFEVKARCERALSASPPTGEDLETVRRLLEELPPAAETEDPHVLGAWGRYHVLAGLLAPLKGRGEMRRGLEQLRACYRRNPGDYGSALLLAWTQAALSRPDNGLLDASLTTLDRLLMAAPDLTAAQRLMAEVCYRNGLYARSRQMAARVIEADPKDHLMRKLLARAAAATEDTETAIRELERVRREDETDFECRLWLSQLYLQRGEQGFAKALFEEARKAAPEGEAELAVVESIASIYRLIGQPEQALETIRILLERDPDSVRIHMAYVNLLISLGRVELALERLREMLARDPGSVRIRRRICEVYLQRREDSPELGRILADLRARDPDLPDLDLLEGSRHLILASRAGEDGDEEATKAEATRAAERLERYVMLREADLNGHYSLGIARFLLGDLDGAAESLRRAEEAGASGIVLASALLRVHGERARRMLSQGRVNDAVELLRGLIRANPDAAVGEKRMLAWALQRMGKFGASRRELEAILRADETDWQAWALLGGLHEREGRLRDAARAYEKVLEIQPDAAVWRYVLATTLSRLGELDRALSQIAEAARRDPDSEELLLLQVRTLMESGRSDEALSIAKRRIEERPRDPLGYELEGRVLLRRADIEGALKAMETAHELAPDRPQTLVLLVGLEADHRNEIPSALRRARQAVASHPENAQLRYILGYVLVVAEEILEAAATFEKVLELDPDHEAARIHLVRLEFQIGRLEKARRYLEPLLPRAVWRPDIAMLAALVHESLDAPRVAEKYYRMILAVAPDHTDALNNLAWLLATERQPGAEDLAKHALAVKPDEPDVIDTYGFVLQQKGRLTKAKEMYEKAIALYGQRIRELEMQSREWTHGEHVRKKFQAIAKNVRANREQVQERLRVVLQRLRSRKE
jgi:tetratricopeptide (TPR) repeat protein